MKLFIALVMLLAAGIHAHAQGIVYFSYGAGVWVGFSESFAPQDTLIMDLNGDGVNDFRFVGESAFGGGLYLEPQNRNGVLGYPADRFSSAYLVRRLAAGNDISSTTSSGLLYVGYNPQPLSSITGPYLLYNLSRGGDGGGEFARANSRQTEGYVGVQFFAADGLHYGWIRVRGGNYNDGRILDYAYNTVPGQGLAAGVVPEPSTLALLALGVAALFKFRPQPRPD